MFNDYLLISVPIKKRSRAWVAATLWDEQATAQPESPLGVHRVEVMTQVRVLVLRSAYTEICVEQ